MDSSRWRRSFHRQLQPPAVLSDESSVGRDLIAEWWRGPALLANRALFGRSRRFLYILFALGRIFRLDRFQLSQKVTVRVFAHGDLEGAIGPAQRK